MQLCELGNPAGEILTGSNEEIDTTKNSRRNEGIYVIVNISPISPKLT